MLVRFVLDFGLVYDGRDRKVYRTEFAMTRSTYDVN
jgi:hypothetical protein